MGGFLGWTRRPAESLPPSTILWIAAEAMKEQDEPPPLLIASRPPNLRMNAVGIFVMTDPQILHCTLNVCEAPSRRPDSSSQAVAIIPMQSPTGFACVAEHFV